MPTFQSHKIHASKSSFISCHERGIYLDLQNSLPEGQWGAWLSRKFFPSNGQNSSGKNWSSSFHWNSTRRNPWRQPNFVGGKISFFFPPTFWIQDLSMATTTHPPTFPLPQFDHHLFCTSVWILFRFGVTVFAWEIVGGFNKTQCFFPCGEKIPGHQNWPYLSTGMKGTIRFLWLLHHQFSFLTWFTLEAPKQLKSTFPRIFEEMDRGEPYEFIERYSVLTVNSSFLHLTLK